MSKTAPKNHRTDKVEARLRNLLQEQVDQETLEKAVGIATNALENSKKREAYFREKALQVDRRYDASTTKIRGALISCIDTHGNITRKSVNSAAKRVHGELLDKRFFE